eukprot:11165965-Ditylum_brightwellii.AAC.1
MAHMILSINQNKRDGFNLLTQIIWELSPQLGGEGEGAETRVQAFITHPGESLYELQCQANNVMEEILLLQDSTGQHNKLVSKIIKLLAAQDDLNMKATMSTYIREAYSKK